MSELDGFEGEAMQLDAEISAIMERIFALPFDAQLAMLRLVGPQVIGWLDAEGQQAFLEMLADAVARAGEGEPLAMPLDAPTY